MIRLIRFLITGDWHLHEWEPYGRQRRLFSPGDNPDENLPSERRQPCRCKNCGKIKSFKL